MKAAAATPWRLRRGSLELELLLEARLHSLGREGKAAEYAALQTMLDLDDQTLLDHLLHGRALVPGEPSRAVAGMHAGAPDAPGRRP